MGIYQNYKVRDNTSFQEAVLKCRGVWRTFAVLRLTARAHLEQNGPCTGSLKVRTEIQLHTHSLFYHALHREETKYYSEEIVYESLISHCHQLWQNGFPSTNFSSQPIRPNGWEHREVEFTKPVTERLGGIKSVKCRKTGLLSAGWNNLEGQFSC